MNKILAIAFTFLCTAATATYAEEGGWEVVETPCRENNTEEYLFGWGVGDSKNEQAAVAMAITKARQELARWIGPIQSNVMSDGTTTASRVIISSEAISKANMGVLVCKSTKQNKDGNFAAYISVRLENPASTTGGKKPAEKAVRVVVDVPCFEEHTEKYLFGWGMGESVKEQVAVEMAVTDAKEILAGMIGPIIISEYNSDDDYTREELVSKEAISKASKSIMSCKTTKRNENGKITAYVSVKLDRPASTTGGEK